MKMPQSRFRALSLIALGLFMFLAFIPKNTYADTVTSSDFQAQSFSKTVDWYDYVRAYALQNGYTPPSTSEHAYIYANYINVGGFQLFYAGLVNATHNGMYVTIPLQTFFEHFKTAGGKDAITASSFISLVSFKENSSDIYANSPDRNDTIYASFSLGVNLAALTGHPVPSYIASSSIIPLKSTDSNHWTWGLDYTNLNAIWWRVNPNPLFPWWDQNTPRGLAQYTELKFNYALAIDPSSKTATVTTSYTVGRMTDLWLLTTNPAIHLNATGTYNLNGSRNSTQTVYQFLQAGQYKLSVVLSQKTILASHTVTNTDDSHASVDNDNSTDVTHTAVSSKAEDGEPVFKSSFGVKPFYNLYNYTKDNSESSFSSYNVNTRTVSRAGWNPLFGFQNTFMGFLPIFVAHVDPTLVQQAKAGMVNIQAADYLYIISYPTWGGYRIVHDPSYTAFYEPASNIGLLTSLFIAVAVAAGVGGVFAFLFRRKRAASMSMAGSARPTPGQTPSPVSGPPGPTR